eukprot:4118411-Pyramimonas_sp.AAC.1
MHHARSHDASCMRFHVLALRCSRLASRNLNATACFPYWTPAAENLNVSQSPNGIVSACIANMKKNTGAPHRRLNGEMRSGSALLMAFRWETPAPSFFESHPPWKPLLRSVHACPQVTIQ